MSVFEIVVSVVLGTYAMVGGSFINAAITSPENTRKILDFFSHTTLTALVAAEILAIISAIWVGAITGWYTLDPNSFLGGNVFAWVGSVHFLFEAIVHFSRWITSRLLRDTGKNPQAM